MQLLFTVPDPCLVSWMQNLWATVALAEHLNSMAVTLQEPSAQLSYLATFSRLLQHIVALVAAYHILRSATKFCKDKYTWWRITAPWWP
jgi:hypothetical protein